MNTITSFTGMYYDLANNKEIHVKPFFDKAMLEAHNNKLDGVLNKTGEDTFSVVTKQIGKAIAVGNTEFTFTDTYILSENKEEGTVHSASALEESESFVGRENVDLIKQVIDKCKQLLTK